MNEMTCSYHNVVGFKFPFEAFTFVARFGRSRQVELGRFDSDQRLRLALFTLLGTRRLASLLFVFFL